MYEVGLIRIKEEVGKKGITVSAHRNADCLLNNTPARYNKYVVNQKLTHFDNISFREFLVEAECIKEKQICPFPSPIKTGVN